MWLAIFHLITQPLYLITYLNEYLLSEQTCTTQTIFRSIKPKQIECFNKVITTVCQAIECNKKGGFHSVMHQLNEYKKL